MRGTRLSTVFLSILNACLIALLGVVWHRGEIRVAEPKTLPVHELAAPDLSVLSSTPAPAINALALRDQAVFYSRRVFYQPPPSESVPVPDYELAGTMGLPQGKRIAFVKKKSDQTSRTVHVGDDLDGWRVDAIEASRVVIVRAEQRVDLPAAGATASPGLLYSGTAPPAIGPPALRSLAGLRVLGAPGPASSAARKPVLTEARTFRPPPTP
jgi:hypothetical protein